MQLQRTLLASAALSVLASISSAQTGLPQQDVALPTVTVTATPFGASEGAQILVPAKVLSGEELRNKMGASLGDTLSHELGVSASAFGAGASRPIIRGLEGSRVKVLQNGMAVSDVSGLSNDHGVAIDGPSARQIEILRGPAALLYGSGAIGGLVNVVNDRIPTVLEPEPTGEAELRHGTVDKSGNASVSASGSVGAIGLHVDGNVRRASDYKTPDGGRLPWSFARQRSLGVGASYIQDWGHVGASVGQVENRYGIPTEEGAQIDQTQTRYDLDTLVKNPLASFEAFKFKLGYTDYRHAELDLSGVPETRFANRGLESRWELTHAPLAGWHGTLGLQTEDNQFSALSADGGAPNTVPITKSTSAAGFVVEERDFGPVRMNAGLRYENVKRRPVTGEDRSFNLTSYSLGGLWSFIPGYGLGATASVAERAPATEELYSQGPHDATGTFDIGNALFAKETSHNVELSLQKTQGLVRWKANLFENHVQDFIHGQITGNRVDEDGLPGGDLRERLFTQTDAVIRGAEVEVSYNLRGSGLSWRGFADTSRGSLKEGGSLPLQPATRFGADIGFKQGPWRAGASVVHAQSQDRLAASETPTPSYTQLDANLAHVQRIGGNDVTWFLLAKNLLNENIRLSTSVIKDVAPLPGRNFIVGLRTRF